MKIFLRLKILETIFSKICEVLTTMNLFTLLFIFAMLVLAVTICIDMIDNLWFKLTGKSLIYDVEYEEF